MKDDLGDRMKLYEGIEADRRMMPLLPTFARVDGRAFHSFTRGMRRPFDEQMSSVMMETALYLVRETNACMGYAQSDEITLVWFSTDSKSQIWFDGRHSKMVSQIAAHATLQFYRLIVDRMPEYAARLPTFDARVWQVPNRAEGANVFLWRERDATKNSISMAANSVYSDKALHGKTGSEKQEMLFQKNINWNDYPTFFKRGSFVQRRKVVKPFSVEEIYRLPKKHTARSNPALTVERSEWRVLEMPPFGTVVNREAVVFDGADYEIAPTREKNQQDEGVAILPAELPHNPTVDMLENGTTML
jgi:tRNA(His) guanylyltransferase